jgi:hypothetical protein
MKIRPLETEFFHAYGRRDITKLIVAFRNFANASKKPTLLLMPHHLSDSLDRLTHSSCFSTDRGMPCQQTAQRYPPALIRGLIHNAGNVGILNEPLLHLFTYCVLCNANGSVTELKVCPFKIVLF